MRWFALLPLMVLASCDSQTPAEKAAADARDIAAVEAAQKVRPPATPLSPQPILFPDIQKAALYSPGCAFVPEGGGLGALVMTEAKRAAIKPKGALVILASDPGSAKLPQGSWSRYVGKEYALTLTRIGEGTDAAFSGKLIITDPYDHVVYEATGQVQCKG